MSLQGRGWGPGIGHGEAPAAPGRGWEQLAGWRGGAARMPACAQLQQPSLAACPICRVSASHAHILTRSPSFSSTAQSFSGEQWPTQLRAGGRGEPGWGKRMGGPGERSSSSGCTRDGCTSTQNKQAVVHPPAVDARQQAAGSASAPAHLLTEMQVGTAMPFSMSLPLNSLPTPLQQPAARQGQVPCQGQVCAAHRAAQADTAEYLAVVPTALGHMSHVSSNPGQQPH